MNDKIIAFTLLRMTLGINLLIHGLVRFGNYILFIESMESSFKKTFLPRFLIESFVWILPPVEALIGLLLILGLMTRFAAISGAVLMALFVFGTGLIQNWSVMASQMIYSAIYFILIFNMRYNFQSVDYWMHKK